MKKSFVDLHSHAHMKAYGHSFKSTGPTYHNSNNPKDKNSSWWRDWPTGKDLKKNAKGLFGLTQFTQADIRTCIEGNVKVVFSSLYPLEGPFTKPWSATGKIADKLLNMITGFGIPRIDFIQAIKDYYPDLVNEYQFQLAHHGQIKEIDGKKYRYQFVNSYEQLNTGLNKPEDGIEDLFIINSIEGAHAFGTGIAPYTLDQDIELILERIQAVKSWEFPPFFITLAHHFYNEICGHARSLGVTGLFLNQRKGINTGFTPNGERILHALLDDNNGPRVLIDVKHMSLQARKEYYGILETFYGFEIPILVSHGCVTGFDNRINGKDKSSVVPGNSFELFRSDDINFYDFELVNISKSGGLFGIQLDERRIAGKKARKRMKKARGNGIPFEASKLVWRQIQHIAEVLDANDLFAWDIQSLGTDFDGIVDPIDGFFTVAHFSNLYDFLIQHAETYIEHEMRHRIKNDFNRISAEEIIERFASKNAMRFLEQHFNATVTI